MTRTELDIIEEGGPVTLFGTTDPKVTLERMGECAGALVDVVRDRRLSVRIQGKEHLTVEAWTTLGALVGVYAVIEWTKQNETEDGYVARARAQTLDGRIVGAAEAECSRVESTWRSRDPYALRSMAQTRAISRALRAPLGQIVVLAGYEATAEEEMPTEASRRPGVIDAEPPVVVFRPAKREDVDPDAQAPPLKHSLEDVLEAQAGYDEAS